jgi:DNA-binding GntR family transcriptional regulator
MRYVDGVTELDTTGPDLAYLLVADAIAARITAGQYTRKLPSERDLAEEFGVSYVTVRRGMAILRERGLIRSVHGKGTFVAQPGSHVTARPNPGPQSPGQPARPRDGQQPR